MSGARKNSRGRSGRAGRGVTTPARSQPYVEPDYTPEPYRGEPFEFNLNAPLYTPEYDFDGNPVMTNPANYTRNLELEFAQLSPSMPNRIPSSQSSRSRMSEDSTFLALLGSSGQQHFSQGIEDLTIDPEDPEDQEEEEEEEEETEIPSGGTQRGKQAGTGSRGPIYKKNADMTLIKAWLQQSEDPKSGTDQSNNTFWEKVYARCLSENRHFYEQKTWQSAKARWLRISRAVNIFSGLFALHSGSRARSGENEENFYNSAVADFNQHQRHSWDFGPHWQLLRHHPKWCSYSTDPLRQSFTYRKTGSGSDSGKRSSPSEATSAAMTRPEGRDSAKRAAKGKGKMSKKDIHEEERRQSGVLEERARLESSMKVIMNNLNKQEKYLANKRNILHTTILPDEQTTNAQYYQSLLDEKIQLKSDIDETVNLMSKMRKQLNEILEKLSSLQ